jgi:hypothetical protein
MVMPILSQLTKSGLVPFPLVPRQWERYVDVPFVIPALTFPWDIFCGIEQEYYQHLYDMLREERMNRLTKAFPVSTSIENSSKTSIENSPVSSTKDRI